MIARVVIRRRLGEPDSDVTYRRSRPVAERLAHVQSCEPSPTGGPMELGHPPKRIDLTSIDGVSFEECWPDHVELDVVGIPVPFIDVEHLLVNRRASGRLQDLAEAEALSAGLADRP